MENGPRPARAEFTRAPGHEADPKPKPAHDPLALRPRSPCQAALRPETKISPAARSRSARPTLQATTWAWAGKVSSRLS
jgi:hypothetical protein